MNKIHLDKKQDKILFVIFIISIIVMSFSVLTYGQTGIHADVATATLLSKSMLEKVSLFPSGWNYVNDEIWVIGNHIFCFLPTVLMTNQPLARMIGSLIFVLATVLGFVYQSRKLFNDNSYLISVPLTLVYLLGCLDHVLYQTSYTGQVFWAVLCTTWVFYSINIDEKKLVNKKYTVLYAILIILIVMSGSRAIAEETLPTILAVFVISYIKLLDSEGKNFSSIKKELEIKAAVVLIPAFIGMILHKVIAASFNINSTSTNDTIFVETVRDVFDNCISAFLNLFIIFGYTGDVAVVSLKGLSNLVSIVMCVIICIVVPVLQLQKLKEENEATRFFFFYAMIHNAVLSSIVILCGKLSARYMLTVVFIFIIVSARYIYSYWICSKKITAITWTTLFVLATLIQCANLASLSSGWKTELQSKKEVSKQLLERNITKAYATYWNAYNNEVYSDCKVRFAGITVENDCVTEFHWLVDDTAFIYENNISSALLLTDEELEKANAYFDYVFGDPVENFKVNDLNIFIFNHDIGFDINNGFRDNELKPVELKISEAGGQIYHDYIELLPGGNTYGPWGTLEKGDYTAVIYGENLDEATVTVDADIHNHYLTYEEKNHSAEAVELALSFSNTTDFIQFIIKNESADKKIKVTDIVIKKR